MSSLTMSHEGPMECSVFPVEIFSQIIPHLGNLALCSLAVTCRAVRCEVERHIYRVVRLDEVYVEEYQSFQCCLRVLAMDPRRAEYVRELHLPERIPRKSPLRKGSRSADNKGGASDAPPHLIEGALTRMTNVRRVYTVALTMTPTWDHGDSVDIPRCYALTTRALMMLSPSLRTFRGAPAPWSVEYARFYAAHPHIDEWSLIPAAPYAGTPCPIPPDVLPALTVLYINANTHLLKYFCGRPLERISFDALRVDPLGHAGDEIIPFHSFARTLHHVHVMSASEKTLKDLSSAGLCNLRSLTLHFHFHFAALIDPSVLESISSFSGLTRLICASEHEYPLAIDVLVELLQTASRSLSRIAVKHGPCGRWDCFARELDMDTFKWEVLGMLDEQSWKILE